MNILPALNSGKGGADPDMRNTNGETKLNEVARYGDIKCVRLLLDAGSDLEAEMPESGRGWTAMVSAYTAGRDKVVEMLTDAGARDERVNGANGDPLTDKSDAMQAVRAYIAAIQSGDLQTIKRIRTGKSLDWYEKIDFKTWKNYCPSEPKLKQGFGNENAATIELMAHIIEEYPVRWFFHLDYIAEGNLPPQWRILREWNLPLSN